VQGDAARGIGFVSSVGDGLFVFGTGGLAGDKPKLYLLSAADPENPVFGGTDVPAALQVISGGDGLIFTTDRNSLIIYRVNGPPRPSSPSVSLRSAPRRAPFGRARRRRSPSRSPTRRPRPSPMPCRFKECRPSGSTSRRRSPWRPVGRWT